MAKESMLEMTALVIDVLPGTQFKVLLVDENFKPINNKPIRAILSGKMRQLYNIRSNRILENDYVIVEISPYDMNIARIKGRVKMNNKNENEEQLEIVDESNKNDFND